MSKFKFLITFGLRKRLFRKAFIITNILIGVASILLINLPMIMDYFSSDEVIEEVINVKVVNQTEDSEYPLEVAIIEYLNMTTHNIEYVASEVSLETYTDLWETEGIDILLVISDTIESPSIEIYSKESHLNSSVINRVQQFVYDYQEVSHASFEVIAPPTDDDGLTPEDRMFVEGILSMLFLPVFFMIILATQMLGVDIIEEKSSKAIETVIASVPAKIHFLSKITSTLLFLVIQTVLLLSFAALGLLVSRLLSSTMQFEELSLLGELASQIPGWPLILMFAIFFMLFGALLFLVIASLLAALATTQEDYQQFQAPLIILILSGFYAGIFLPLSGGDAVLRVAAYVPIFSPFVAPIAFATNVLSIGEMFIVLAVLMVFVGLLLYLVSPIYKVAILSYEQTKPFKRAIFYIKKAFSKAK